MDLTRTLAKSFAVACTLLLSTTALLAAAPHLQNHDYYTDLAGKLSGDTRGLASREDLLRGPEELVALIDSDPNRQRAALNHLQSLDHYGNRLLPYLGYIIASAGNWMATSSAFNYLFQKAYYLELKSRWEPPPGADEDTWLASVEASREGVEIDFESYPPLESILYYAMSVSPDFRSRDTAARILAGAYGGSTRLEEALIKQIENSKSPHEHDERFALLARMSRFREYKYGYQSDRTMDVVISEFGREDADRTLVPAMAVIGQYQPAAALPVIKTIITRHDTGTIRFSLALTALQQYGNAGNSLVPDVQEALAKEGENGKYADLLRATLEAIDAEGSR